MESLESARTPGSPPSARARALPSGLEIPDRGALRAWAIAADAEGRLAREGMGALERAGLVGFLVPAELGGSGGTITQFARIAGELGAGCLSTAMNWVMHGHQALSLADHGGESAHPVLRRVADEGAWIASVTTEEATGSGLLKVDAPLVKEAGAFRVQRDAPYVSYGEYATYFLITMRRSRESSLHDVQLVLVEHADGEIRSAGEWKSMGLRGTASAPMSFDVLVDPSRVLPAPMPAIAVRTMVPVAHAGWCAAWLGAARGAFQLVAARLSETSSDHVQHRLGELRLSLDLGQALLEQVAAELDAMRAAQAPSAAYEDVGFHVRVNELKVAGGRLAFEVVDGLVQLAGLREGYLQGGGRELERVFRDLRAASLMLNDDGLLVRNGRLSLTEGTGLAKPR